MTMRQNTGKIGASDHATDGVYFVPVRARSASYGA